MNKDNTTVNYNPTSIEAKWQKRWSEAGVFAAKDFDPKPKYWVMDMFPFLSGAGLHVGHFEGYIATDIVARSKRAQGHNVLYPMGWDAFGLPVEQFAIKTGQHPSVAVRENVAKFRDQASVIGLSYDWSREVNTTDPLYYKWTQWIFLKMFEKGLAYVANSPVWWCPQLGTVLANEEVVDGKSEVGGYPVERRCLLQWVLKITAYADKLLQGLESLDWPQGTLRQQVAWIGRSEGAEVVFDIDGFSDDKLVVYTTRPDTLFGVTFMVIAPEHPLVQKITTKENKAKVDAYIKAASSKSDMDRTELNKDKSGVFTGAYAINPVNGRKVQVWVGDYVLGSYGTGAIIAVPAHDERDFEFAKKHGIKIIPVIEGPNKEPLPYTESGKMINSGQYDGMNSDEFQKRIVEDMAKVGRGKSTVNYKLHDWIFSRQRYWGEPFPILWISEEDYQKIDPIKTKLVISSSPVTYTDNGNKFYAVGLPFESLPLELPAVESYKPSGTGESPLANIKDWVNVFVDLETGQTFGKPQNKSVPARRETNTMPQWAGSSWYHLRYTDPANNSALIDPQKEKYWGTPDFYVGGAEHAVLHLLYARFWHQFLYDIGVVTTKEPFKKLFHQGMILGADHQKMSKSHPETVVTLDSILPEYGADTLRLYEMFMGPLGDMKPWNTKGIEGVYRFLKRAYNEFIGEDGHIAPKVISVPEKNEQTEKLLHATIKKVTQDIEALRFNTAISQMMIFLNHVQTVPEVSINTVKAFIQLLAPFAPHMAEEIWERLGGQGYVCIAPWPSYDEKKLISEFATIAVQINGKFRAELELPVNADEVAAMAAAKANERVKAQLADKAIHKVIFVKGRLLNIVTI